MSPDIVQYVNFFSTLLGRTHHSLVLRRNPRLHGATDAVPSERVLREPGCQLWPRVSGVVISSEG